MKTVFLRALESDDKATALLTAIHEPEMARGRQRFEVDALSFAAVPRSPFTYWVSDRLRMLFTDRPPFEQDGRSAKTGLSTEDDFRFIRCHWEIARSPSTDPSWVDIVRGGKRSHFYSPLHAVINWGSHGRELKALAIGRYGNAGKRIFNEDYYFKPGLTWPLRGARFSASAVPAGCVFSGGGKMAFVPRQDLLAFNALFNSGPFSFLIRIQSDAVRIQFEAGLVQRVPIPSISAGERNMLASLSQSAWSLKRSLDTRTEISHAFVLPALLQVEGANVATRAAAWSEHVRTVEADVAGIQAEIDEHCFALYGIDEADRCAITERFATRGAEEAASDRAGEAEDDVAEDFQEDTAAADAVGLAQELLSWAVGVAFGRFDMRLATGARPLPPEPESFDPLPTCSPGMLTGGDALPLTQPPAGYPLAFPEAGVLVDDPGHAEDLTAAARAVFEVVFGADADRWWSDTAALLDPKGHDLRAWLAGSLFEYHLKRHSKSRRKAPIFWQLGTSSGRYSVWLYAHRLTRDSFFQLQNEVVGPKLTHEERQLTSLVQNAGGSPSASERKAIAAQEAFVEELRAMLDEIKRVGPVWNPDLDDGVVLTMAPLWRLVPQHKPWQKELKGKWDELAAGNYDWAHLALHLWPERVVPKCATDRSLAIAHGLEDVLWVEGADGKWKARGTPVRPVDELVRERSSLAVKTALKRLLDAPEAVSASKRTRLGRTDA